MLLPHGSDSNTEFKNPNFIRISIIKTRAAGVLRSGQLSVFGNTVTHTNRPKRLEWSHYQIQTPLTLPLQEWNSNTSEPYGAE